MPGLPDPLQHLRAGRRSDAPAPSATPRAIGWSKRAKAKEALPFAAAANASSAAGNTPRWNASEERSIKVVKKDGVRVPFERQKIKQGLEKACWKRPVSDEQLEQIVSAIETEVHGKFEAEVESSWLGELLMQHLRQLDQVAYVRFASVYRQFQDVHDFVEELEPMLAEKRGEPRAASATTRRARVEPGDDKS